VNEAVIDTSVILAILKSEAIDERAYAIVDGAVMSAVNVAEVYTKLSDYKWFSAREVDILLETLDRIEPLTLSQARAAGLLRDSTRHAGLSLGDRCCLALAIELGADAYTAEHVWSRVDVGCKIHLLR
jgi:PIN domain nuclease of toxin-antitoxin system